MIDNSLQSVKESQEASQVFLEANGRTILPLLFATLKVAGMYEANNNRYIDQVAKLRQAMDLIFAEETDFTLTTTGGYFFISDYRIRTDHEIDAALAYFLERWPALGISGFSFNKNLDPRELEAGRRRDHRRSSLK